MGRTTRKIVTLASCGVAFALPVVTTSNAYSSPIDTGSLTVFAPDGGTARTITSARGTITFVRGDAYGPDGGPAKTILISKFGPQVATPDYTSTRTRITDGSVITRTKSQSGTTANGVIISLTKTAASTIISRYDATAACSKYAVTVVSTPLPEEGLRIATPGTKTAVTDSCEVQGSGVYVAKGAAVVDGLPAVGTTDISSIGVVRTKARDGVVTRVRMLEDSFCQSFNTRDDCGRGK